MRRGWRAALLACALVLAARVVAYAHASLVSSTPAAGSQLPTAPSQVRLLFTEAIEPSLASITLIDAARRQISLAVASDPHDVDAIVAPATDLHPGAYRLHWRVVSADGHPVEGSFTFAIGVGAAGPPPPDVAIGSGHATWGPAIAGAPIAPALLRGLALGALLAAAGLLFFVVTSRERDRSSARAPARLTNFLIVAAPLLLATHAALWIVNAVPEHALTSDTISAALASNVGMIELWRTGLALLACWALLLARRAKLALLFAAASLALSGATGHSAALSPAWAIPGKAVHLLAGAVWLGGVLYLATFDSRDRPAFTRTALRVSNAALWSVIVVAFSGVVQTRLFVPSLMSILHSPYGALVLAKVAGLLVLVAFGALHRYRALPSLEKGSSTGGMATTLRAELAIMLVVILLGGLLAYVPPPMQASMDMDMKMHMNMDMHGDSSHPVTP
jgi:copper transport protein